MIRRKMIRGGLATILAISMLFTAGCQKKTGATTQTTETVDVATKEIRQNDYRGGYKRTEALYMAVLKTLETMKSGNEGIRTENPDDYWTKDGYQEFVSTFLSEPIIEDTQWFNEEEATWEETVAEMAKHKSSFTHAGDKGYVFDTNVKVHRYEKNDYGITGTKGSVMLDNRRTLYSGDSYYTILYDNDKDWCKAYETIDSGVSGVPAITCEMFEYARVDKDRFVVQTTTERLIVIFEPETVATAEDGNGESTQTAITDIRQRKVKEFYYSKLSGQRRSTFENYKYRPVDAYEDLNKEYTGSEYKQNEKFNEYFADDTHLNPYGDVDVHYGINDSVFLGDVLKNIDEKWVYEDTALGQAISYKDGALVVTTFNKLSKKYERFIYTMEGAEGLVSSLEGLVDIDGLGEGEYLPVEKPVITMDEYLEAHPEIKDERELPPDVKERLFPSEISDDEGNTMQRADTEVDKEPESTGDDVPQGKPSDDTQQTGQE